MYQIENDDLKVILSDTGGLVRIYNKLTGQENLFSDCGFSLVSDLAKKNLAGKDMDFAVREISGTEVVLQAECQEIQIILHNSLLENELNCYMEIKNTGAPVALDYLDLIKGCYEGDVYLCSSSTEIGHGDAGNTDLNIQAQMEAYPFFAEGSLFFGIDWPVAQHTLNEGKNFVCRQYIGDKLETGGTWRSRTFTAGISRKGEAARAFMEHLRRLRGRETRRASFYFDWLTHASEGTNAGEMNRNLDFMEWLQNEYGVHFDIYAVDDGAVESRWGRTFDKYRLVHEELFTDGLSVCAERCHKLGMDFGVGIGPDGFGDEFEYTEGRIGDITNMVREWKLHLFKIDACVSVPLTDDPYHNEKYMQRFERLMQECREINPRLIVINHRITNSPYILGILDSTLWQGAESYPDVFLYNEHKARLFTRYASFERKCPSYFGEYSALLEDHGICMNGISHGWQSEFVVQAFGRALMLSPEVYGCLFMLPDEDFKDLGYLSRLAEEKKELLSHTEYLEEFHCYLHKGEQQALLSMVNDDWNVSEVTMELKELLPDFKGCSARILYPVKGEALNSAGDRLCISMSPFSVALIEVNTEEESREQDIRISTLKAGMMRASSVYLGNAEARRPEESDIRNAEFTKFQVSSDASEAQALLQLPPSKQKAVAACREAFLKKIKRECGGVAENAWDGDPLTQWNDYADAVRKDSVWRLDLGAVYPVKKVVIQLSDKGYGPTRYTGNIMDYEDMVYCEYSRDCREFRKEKMKVFYKRVPMYCDSQLDRVAIEFRETADIRYLRMKLDMLCVENIKVYEQTALGVREVSAEGWKGNNLLTNRLPKAVYTLEYEPGIELENRYVAVTAKPESPVRIALNQESAVVWAEKEDGSVIPFTNASPLYPAYHWECGTDLPGTGGWTFYHKADKDLGGNKIKLKLAWYGIEEPEDLRIKVDGYSVINAV